MYVLFFHVRFGRYKARVVGFSFLRTSKTHPEGGEGGGGGGGGGEGGGCCWNIYYVHFLVFFVFPYTSYLNELVLIYNCCCYSDGQ